MTPPQPFNDTPLTLPEDGMLAEGYGRQIYNHPFDPSVVIKIAKLRPASDRALRLHSALGFGPRAFGPLWNSQVEARELLRAAGRVGRVARCCAQFRGLVSTNKGVGAMFDAVRAADGSLAPTALTHAQTHGHDPAMEAAIDAFWAEVKDNWIVLSDRALRNQVVVTTQNGYRLVAVDGIGERTFIPIKSMSRRLHAKACDRYHAKMQAAYRKAARGDA
ncbi:YrbL family protein [Pseudooctadecabacter jejudonensis]|uniref:PhoP regulatory network protein YrbL n=1 Tax=Pseudooctadecabacter jejudonensis TaxID=1391910 RepID=A0A1Y5SL68_9RHOB|nr:YrbL family protein [Pseudooctadecabacter jejudonensis]SLN43170.1 hypothetical protein PSJ8397_02206 [Pseudooctadecabacter jejudonensis]